jgi:hypothetical protein
MTGWVAEGLTAWAAYYGNHAAVSGAVRFLHLAGVMVGGGTSLALDRQILAAGADHERRQRTLAWLAEAHRVVVPGLAVAGLTGSLMVAADPDTFLSSRTFAVKVAALVLLGANGDALRRVEQQAHLPGAARAWSRLRGTAVISTALWLLILLLGVWLGFSA